MMVIRSCSYRPTNLLTVATTLVAACLVASMAVVMVNGFQPPQPAAAHAATCGRTIRVEQQQQQRDSSCNSSSSSSSCTTGSNSDSSWSPLALNRREALAATAHGALRSGTAAAALLLVSPPAAQAAYVDPTLDPLAVTQRVYLDVNIPTGKKSKETPQQAQRIVIGLYGQTMPRTVENFVALARTNAYAGTTFYRVLSDYAIQGGAIGDATGKSGQSSAIGGAPFEPDSYNIKHTVAGLVSMVRAGPAGGADSRFFINCADDGGWADDRYAAFGKVEEGSSMDVVRKIEKVNVQRPANAPKLPVEIVASGVL